ncbi:MAG TPA: hypothetical protein VHX65_16675 [Pirellulales bacterium]|jgi:hypothetical protein|nr:hypothetical protein [Pirellulales bacterium]
MQVTGGNVGRRNARIGPTGSITVSGGQFFLPERIRGIQIIDRESSVNFWNAAGNIALGDMLAGSTGEVIGAILTRPKETLTVAVSLWWDKVIVATATHDEFRTLAAAAAVNGGREPPRPTAIENTDPQDWLVDEHAAGSPANAGEFLADLERHYDKQLRLRRTRGLGRLAMVAIIAVLLATAIAAAYCLCEALRHLPGPGH